MCDEAKSLHCDVPEHQDATPEDILIRSSLLQNITQHNAVCITVVTNRTA